MTKRQLNGSKNAISRYSKLKESLDNDSINNNWTTVDTQTNRNKDSSFNYVDLFSGAGGLSLGFRQAGFNKILSIEVDPDASSTIKNNFRNSVHIQSEIEKVSDEQILEAIGDKTIHVVCGGPPCNGFSVAGLRNPQDPRNQLFKEFYRVVKLIKPWVVVMENVPGILTMEKGKVKEEIISLFSKIRYKNMSVRILEAATYEVPQLRTRAIFIANRFSLKNPYPKEILKRKNYIPIEEAITDLQTLPRDPNINHEWTRHRKEFEDRIAKVKPGASLYPTYRDAYKRQHLGVPCMAIKENHGGTHIHPVLNRVISAREMARLQTFPDEFIFSGTMKRAMWQVGNAVPVLMAKHIALALKTNLNKIMESKTTPILKKQKNTTT
jgi:DNA (cytosine-5)-methyltransferase 1